MARKDKRRPKYGTALLDNEPSPKPGDDDARTREARAYKHWMDEISSAKRESRDYWQRGRKIVKLYKDERKNVADGLRQANDRMNILWSNVETLKPALYSKTPAPNVSRRFMDGDPVSRTAALIIERCLITAIDLADFDYPMMRARDDYLLPGRGTVWVRYNPTIEMASLREPVTRIDLGPERSIYRPFKGGDEIPSDKVKTDDDGLEYYETDPVEQVLAYGLDLDHLLWSDYLHDCVNDWTKLGWQAKRIDMKRPRLIKEFKDKGRRCSLNKSFNAKPLEASDDGGTGERGKPDCAEVWEIWSKDHKKVFWVSDALPDELLKVQDDPLGLHDFWPLPRPIFATVTTDSLIPVPDYALYQDQAEQLDRLTDRIRLLIDALRVVGVFNAEMRTLDQLLNETGENQMVPVDNWMTFAQSGGLKGNLDWLPIEMIATVLTQLFQARAQIKNDLYEVSGISDVIRGATAPEETATAQQIKANYGNLRLQARQSEMARFARDTIRKMAEIMAEHYSEEALIEMSGVGSMDEFKPTNDPEKDAASAKKLRDAVALLKSDKLRTFRIDIETDATVAPDQQREKEARVEFLTAVAPFLEKAAMVGAQVPQLTPLLMKMLDFGVKGFRTGRTLENAIEETIQMVEKMQAEAQQAGPQAPPPDPAAEAMAAKLKVETEKLQAELAKLQAEAQVTAQENQAKAIEFQRQSDERRQLHNQQMMKLTEEIAFRKQENTKRLQELDASITLARLKIQELQNGSLAELQSMVAPPQSPVDEAANRAAIAENQVKLVEMQKKYAELKRQSQGLALVDEATAPDEPGARSSLQLTRDANGNLVGAVSDATTDPDESASAFGTPAFGKRKRVKKVHQFLRDPQTNQIVGATTDEIEMPDEENAA